MRQNVDPKIWGTCAWTFLRHCAEACDDTCQESYRQFIELLPEVLPCEQCREHSGRYIMENPVDTDDLVSWIDRFRLAVAERKAKDIPQNPAKTLSRTEGCSRCGESRKTIIRNVLLILGVLIGCALVILIVVGLVKLTKAGQIK